MSFSFLVIVLAGNLFLIFLLMGMPVGRITVTRSISIKAAPSRIWQAIHPLGLSAGWSGEIVSAEDLGEGRVRTVLSRLARDGGPVIHEIQLSNVEKDHGFDVAVVEDNTLDHSFWKHYWRKVRIASEAGHTTRVTVTNSDIYKGLAFAIFRYFALRRELAKLKQWVETGEVKQGGVFEHPLTQFAFAGVSVLLFWPLFGLNQRGLVLATMLTVVVALHELGHMAAFRMMGHKTARMIFIPMLGGIALGGRPYHTYFEVAFSALMGAGFSAFLIPIAMFAYVWFGAAGEQLYASYAVLFGGLCALFNGANLLPVWKFDGGQVLRQVFTTTAARAVFSFAILGGFLGLGFLVGVPVEVLYVTGAVVVLLSLLSRGRNVRPRHDLIAMTSNERLLMAAGLTAVLATHAAGLVWTARIIWA